MVESGTGRCVETAKGSFWPHQRSLRSHQRLSRALRQAGVVSLQMDNCVWILPASSPVKGVSPVDVPTKLKAAVADSSVSPVPEIRMDRWWKS